MLTSNTPLCLLAANKIPAVTYLLELSEENAPDEDHTSTSTDEGTKKEQ